ncbi:MAG: hypothetical protein U1F46_14995 [Marinagarivorans sp.]
MLAEFTATPLLSGWPFWVLELDPTADNRSIERAYQKITSSLQLKIAKAEEFNTPLGVRIRDEYLLREAKALLINPHSRVLAEFWYVAPDCLAQSLKKEHDSAEPNRAGSEINWRQALRTG